MSIVQPTTVVYQVKDKDEIPAGDIRGLFLYERPQSFLNLR
jgi:hypothetical protein